MQPGLYCFYQGGLPELGLLHIASQCDSPGRRIQELEWTEQDGVLTEDPVGAQHWFCGSHDVSNPSASPSEDPCGPRNSRDDND